jgi:hypothetical protein
LTPAVNSFDDLGRGGQEEWAEEVAAGQEASSHMPPLKGMQRYLNEDISTWLHI